LGTSRVVIAGCGFLGEAAAFLFAKRGHSVLGLCATQATSVKLVGRPFEILKADISGSLSEIPAVWKQPDLLIHCASTGGGSADDYRNLYRDGLANLLEFFAPRRVLFTGSTSVYAQTTGEWVDEESPAQPARETSRILLEAESLAWGAGGVAPRLAGLYLAPFIPGSADKIMAQLGLDPIADGDWTSKGTWGSADFGTVDPAGPLFPRIEVTE